MGSSMGFSIKAYMGTTRNITLGVEEAGSKKVMLRKALEDIHSQSSSVLGFSLQWKELEDHFNSMNNKVLQKIEDLQMKEKEMISAGEKLDQRMIEINAKEKEFDAVFKFLDDRGKKVNTAVIENEQSVQMYLKEFEEREKQLCLREESVARREKELDLKEKSIAERPLRFECSLKGPDLRKKFIEQHGKEVETKVNHVDSVKKSIEEKEKLNQSGKKRTSHMSGGLSNRSPSFKAKEGGFLALLRSVEDRAKES